jgi:DNA polymerase I
MARLYLHLRLLYELRLFLSKMHLEELAVSLDGYNRTMVSIFRSIAGRHQLSTTKFIFGPAAWIAATQQFEVKRRRASGHGKRLRGYFP